MEICKSCIVSVFCVWNPFFTIVYQHSIKRYIFQQILLYCRQLCGNLLLLENFKLAGRVATWHFFLVDFFTETEKITFVESNSLSSDVLCGKAYFFARKSHKKQIRPLGGLFLLLSTVGQHPKDIWILSLICVFPCFLTKTRCQWTKSGLWAKIN